MNIFFTNKSVVVIVWSFFNLECFLDSNFVLGNAQVLSVYPIVYCSDGFCELTGYTRAQIMHKGCACEFMYGAETKEEIKQSISKALESRTELKIEMICYKKNSNFFFKKIVMCSSFHLNDTTDVFNRDYFGFF